MTGRIPREIWRETQGYLKKNTLKEEDLPALLYLYSVVNEIDGKMTFDHVVIDEAQDFSPFQVYVLDRFVKGHSFTILGDLSQGIHYYKRRKKLGGNAEPVPSGGDGLLCVDPKLPLDDGDH
ncbi:hypothetical protein HMSSN036_92600 [Paenibacillus macerans]|nr:hypothetical protein HMSSN036_92600 [Paenibacillus macerans]